MASSVFDIGVSGLNVAQAGLATAGHNISNANTPGFHRQQISQSTNVPIFTGNGFFGQGAHLETIKRTYSQFLDNQVMQVETQSSQLGSYLAQVKQLDNMLADVNAGLSPALQEFFNGVHDVAANPASVPSRQALISGGQAMAARFQALGQRFQDIRDGINAQITSSVDVINSYARQIANINQQIALAQSSTGDQQPANDLLDQRDSLIAQLNKEVQVTTVRQGDGSYSIFIGNGQGLVIGQEARTLTSAPSAADPQKMDVGYVSGGNTIPIGQGGLQGGNLGGLLAFRNETLDTAQNALGRVAIGLAQTFNDQHRLGQDLNGNPGSDFFTLATPKTSANAANAGSAVVTSSLADAGALTTDEYTLRYIGSGNYTLTRQSDSVQTTITAFPKTIDGFTLDLTGTPTIGDNWLIQPTRDGARDIGVTITDAGKIAAAAPMRTAATTTNVGTGTISQGVANPPTGNISLKFNAAATQFDVIDNVNGATIASAVAYTGAGQTINYNGWPVNISAPAANANIVINKTAVSVTSGSATVSPSVSNNVTISFTPDATHYSVVDNTTGTTLDSNVPYTAGGNISYNGWTVRISGTVALNDSFTIAPNSGGVADSRNILLLAGLQTKNTLAKGTASYQGTYSQLVSFVGNKTRQVEVTSKAQESLVSQTRQTQQSMSGVNLDEEAANLLRYQQAYQASGKMIQIATSLFDTLLKLGG